MGANILVTGAGGYIGGSIVASLVAAKSGLRSQTTVHAAVRSDEQVQSLSSLNVQVFQTDLYDEEQWKQYVVENKIDMIVNTASSIDEAIVGNLIRALGARRQVSDEPVYLIHTSGATACDTLTGWTYGKVKDTDPIFDLETKSADKYILRKTDVFTINEAEKNDVQAFTVMPVNIYGRGTGTWNTQSLHIPGYIRAGVKHRQVYKFAEKRLSPLIHIDELVDFYSLLIEAILQKQDLPVGKTGYYFVQSHTTPWWDILEGLAKKLHARGLVDEPTTLVWPSEDIMRESLGVPLKFCYSIWNSAGTCEVENAKLVGWAPTWNTERLLDSLDDEIDAALEEKIDKGSLIRTVRMLGTESSVL